MRPLIISREFEGKLSLRQAQMETLEKLRDFENAEIDNVEPANRYGVQVTPKVLFLNSQGKEMAKRLTGLKLTDYDGVFLEEAMKGVIAYTSREKTGGAD